MSRPDLVAETALIPTHLRFGRVTGPTGMMPEAGGPCTELASGYAQLTARLAALP